MCELFCIQCIFQEDTQFDETPISHFSHPKMEIPKSVVYHFSTFPLIEKNTEMAQAARAVRMNYNYG